MFRIEFDIANVNSESPPELFYFLRACYPLVQTGMIFYIINRAGMHNLNDMTTAGCLERNPKHGDKTL